MAHRPHRLFSLFPVVVSLLLWGGALSSGRAAAQEIKLLFTYGSEKELWLKEVTEKFNAQQLTLPDGRRIHVDLKAMGSGQCVDSVLGDELKPHLTSPASSVWINV